VTRPLVISACQTLCKWGKTGQNFEAEPLYACSGCGSEWVPSEAWTPIDADGLVPAEIQAEIASTTTAMTTATNSAATQAGRLRGRG
jgi:hypothetical protein